jgi:Xaa-Pro aminopeptidase
MLTPASLPALHTALAAVPVDGWLLFDFRGLNPIMAAVVGPEIVGSRRQYVLVTPGAPPVALVHAVDAELWRGWPAAWRRIVWVRREELARELRALVGGKTVAMEYSPEGRVPYGDYVPAGTLEFVRAAGAMPVSSADLVTRYCSAWSAEDLASHRRAAAAIAGIAREAFGRIGSRARSGTPLTEHEVTVWILEAIGRAGLETISAPSVSYGDHAARAHYEAPAEGSAPLVPGQLLLLDLWAKEPGGVFADQTWMASLGAPSQRRWTCSGPGWPPESRWRGPKPTGWPAASLSRRATVTGSSAGPGIPLTGSGCMGWVRRLTTPRVSIPG